jgi:hypothetical protein
MSAKTARTELLKRAREHFMLASEADQSQRERELADLAFYNLEQWPEDIKNARKGRNPNNGDPPVPARPCLVLDKVRAPVAQVLNQERQSDIGIEITSADDFEGLVGPIEDSEIELREGLVRRIQRSSEAADARTWAFSRATIAGRGYYAVLTRYLPGKTADQEVYVQRIYNQDSVRLDPAHEQPDGSDCDWQFVGAWMPWETYKARYPSTQKQRNVISDASSETFTGWATDQPLWVSLSGKEKDRKAVYVVDYYYIELSSRQLTHFTDGTAEWSDEIPEDDPRPVLETRDVVERRAKWCKLDGLNDAPLEETDWSSEFLPIIKVLGLELHPHDEERRAEGMVRPARDGGQGFNAMASKLVETVAYAPIPPILMAVGQDENLEDEWNLSTTRTMGRLHYNQEDAAGKPAPPPFSTPREAPIQPISAGLAMFSESVQSATGVGDPALGMADSSVKSGRMQRALAERSEHGTSNYMDNLIRSVRHEGRVINSLLYPIYGQRPGRLLRMMTGQNESRSVPVGQPFTPHPQTGRPMPAPPGAPNAQTYQLTEDAHFNVAIKVTKNFDTRRDQQNAILGELIGANPELMSVFGDLFFESMDGPTSKQMADRAKVMLAPPVQAMLAAQKSGQPPMSPQVHQQLQQGAQAMQENQALKHVLETKQVEQQGKLAIVKTQEAAATERADKDREAKLAAAAISGKWESLQNAMTLLMQEIARIGSQTHEQQMGAADAGHEEYMAQMAHRQAMEQAQQAAVHGTMAADQQHGQAMAEADQGQQHALEQGQQAAALAPPPAEGAGA